MDDLQIVELYLSRDESAIAQTSQKYRTKLRRIPEELRQKVEAEVLI